MELTDAVNALAGLANETRLGIFRYLVRIGPSGVPAGDLAERFGLPGPTLSFHLAQLCQRGLLTARRDGRHIIYSADYVRMNHLMAYLMSNCCGGNLDLCLSPQAVESPTKHQAQT
jgi:ArsR family transcriptional regulator